MPSTHDWLRDRDDTAVIALLRSRPDLIVPAPSDLSVLAGRVNSGPSVWRAMENLDLFHIQVLQALSVSGASHRPVPADRVGKLLGPGVPAADLARAMERLQTAALLRGDTELQIPASVAAALGPYPAGLGSPGELTVPQATRALKDLGPELRGLLERLDRGVPRGTSESGARTSAPIQSLVEARLLRRIDGSTVELPLEVGMALRGKHPLGPVAVTPSTDDVRDRGVATVDGTAALQSLQFTDLLHRLLEAIGHHPPPALRSGGIGIRELRRLAKILDVDEHLTALGVEVLAAAGLVAASEPGRAERGTLPAGPAWTPTVDADAFLEADVQTGWTQLAQVWLDLRRDPSRVGARDSADKVLNALSPELSWIRGPAERRFVLAALADLPPGSGLDPAPLAARLAWRSPLRPAERRDAVLESTVFEATALGVIAFGALSTAGRLLLAGDTEAMTAALEEALPTPVAQVLIQADLTVVAPGRLQPGLAFLLGQVAELESSGGAAVYRVTPGSVRRGLDSGLTTAEIHAVFVDHSATGVPQALTYLIDDVGRRHGTLRVGTAESYLRSDDPALLDQAVAQATAAGIVVRRLAPTVAVSLTPTADLLAELRQHGLVPAAEDVTGALVDLRPRPSRTRPALPTHTRWREPAVPTDEQLAGLVERMREADAAGPTTGQTPVEALSVLREAVEERSAVWIGYVDSEGSTNHRRIQPIAVSGGSVVAFDPLRGAVRTFALHRIIAVRAAGGDADTGDHPEDPGGSR
ncbi:helicase C-terminal domain-containing protein [Nakamurella flavida]|uniref:Helicase C-terminal domain-containing protein n=1 Tax=Nakamurella flavida TaxID=363630 RepID=A0A938YIW9_9ACTN|nr:helicase C-terminal domain-containing protein [Nakamurella flavida]MBM9475578.1 helicase C-terminal domain-containing protein [Nakamurella flavida]MDP9778146.1 hypothetical protein [Nakamurella flavida]